MNRKSIMLVIMKICGFVLLVFILLMAFGASAVGCYLIAGGNWFIGAMFFIAAVLVGEWVVRQAIDIFKQ